ncbi:cytochrome P450 [Nocardia pseudovaccinii]|uniref:cytochrome P450 n=1 Tax=Nocardia pseudovaccinii TaxID=189540 RepID=UPI0007A452B0|nr:cytochrome P450 [Nocardia pseudovaccinii]
MSSPQYTRSDESLAREIDAVGERIPIYTQAFANNPHHFYQEMRRRYGTLVPVYMAPGVKATLVIDYGVAVDILNDPHHFPADPRHWQKELTKNYTGKLDFLPMVEWRPNSLRADGDSPEHVRYRTATQYALRGINHHQLAETVERIAHDLIKNLRPDKKSGTVDLVEHYIAPLAFMALNYLVGCPEEIAVKVASASADLFESQDTASTNAELDAALLALVNLKRAEPGDDITTRLLSHEANLNDYEMIHQLVTCYSAGSEIPQNLIASTLLLQLTDDKYTGHNAQTTATALTQVLATDPPLANYCITYPRTRILRGGAWLPAHEPVITSMAACSSAPDVSNGDFASNGWHLAWGIGPHRCPDHAQMASIRICTDAIDWLLDALPDMRLAVPQEDLEWRPGPFHRALAKLPVKLG